MLAEEGKLRLEDPLARILPEFKGVMVGVETKDASGKPQLTLVKPQREITIRDLLRHTSGLVYAWSGKSLVRDQYAAANFYNPALTSAEAVSKLAKLPLQSQPGTTWDYGHSTDVLGRVVEVTSGMDLDRFIAERITKPLGMKDTAYWVEPSKLARVAEPQVDAATGKRPPLPPVARRPNWIQGGSGLTSTAGDYARFCQFLLNGGSLDGVRLVSRETIETMRSNQLSAGTLIGPPDSWRDLLPKEANGQGFGLGFLLRTAVGTAGIPGSIGAFSWNGAFGTEFLADPKEQLCAVQMAQLRFPGGGQFAVRALWREQVYKAVRP
jgi:CubicO group peptidase (beta-lactamase class C family)